MTDSPETPSSSTPLFLSGQSSSAPKSSTTKPDSAGSAIPRMGAELGYQVVDADDVAPFRASAVVCLVLGLLSFWAIVAWQMLIVPLVAIVFGVFALRRWSGPRPGGTTIAVIGLVLACGFGAAGATLPLAKRATLGEQGKYFARQFLAVVANGDVELAMELQKEASKRQVKEMNLKKAYLEAENEIDPLHASSRNLMLETIHLAGPDIPWELAEPVRVYVKYHKQRVETFWIDPTGTIDEKVQIELEWTPDEHTGVGNWHVSVFQFYHEVVVAPSVL